MKGQTLALGLTAALLALLPRVAASQTSDADKAAAVALFDEAGKLMAASKFAAACTKYAESNRLDPQLGALVHLADCYEKNGQLASAWASWRDATETAQRRGDSRETIARERAAALEPKLSRLRIEVPTTSDVEGLEIRKDGTVVSRTLWGTAIPVDAGEHVIEAVAPGRKKLVTKIRVASNAAEERYELPALMTESATPPNGTPRTAQEPAVVPGTPTSTPTRPDMGSSAGATQRTLGWVAGGLGVVGLGAGLYFELQRSSKVSDRDDICPSGKNCTLDDKTRIDGLNEDVAQAATLETVSFVAGGILLLGGATLLLTAPSDRPGTSGWIVAPAVARGTFGVAAGRSW